MEQTFRLHGHVTAERARADPFLYLPFQVPARARRITVAYHYAQPVTAPFGMGPGNAIDIGIFDSRGHQFLDAPGFRGWSGSARSEFSIAPHEATPGYIRGPLFPGEWNVVLGVYRVEPEGARYDVSVKVDVADRDAPEDAIGELPPLAGGANGRTAVKRLNESGWYRGDLHCHTVHSDGLNSVQEIVGNAMELGLDFLAVTDHNTTTHHEDMDLLSDRPIALIPGEEVTTYWGHANVWGLREWIEYRCADDETMRAVQRYVLQKNAMISVNHPKCVGPPWLFQNWDGYPCMEVWQAPWRFYNWESLERWDTLLRRGERVVAVGGSDTHSIPPAPWRHPHGLANPTTWVFAPDGCSEQSILDGIRAGHVFITDAPDATQLILTADEDGDGRFEKMMGDTVEAPEGKHVTFRVQVRGGVNRHLWLLCDGHPVDIVPLHDVQSDYRFSIGLSGRQYLRAELRGPRGRAERGDVIWAMTNPIWLRTAGA